MRLVGSAMLTAFLSCLHVLEYCGVWNTGSILIHSLASFNCFTSSLTETSLDHLIFSNFTDSSNLYTVRPLFKKFTQHCETYEPTNCCVKKYTTCEKLYTICVKLYTSCLIFFTQLLVGSYVSQCCVKF